jgi:uncharacterized protein
VTQPAWLVAKHAGGEIRLPLALANRHDAASGADAEEPDAADEPERAGRQRQSKRLQPRAGKPEPGGTLHDVLFGSTGPRGGRRDGLIDQVAKSAARSAGSVIAREISRGILGSLFGGRRRRR